MDPSPAAEREGRRLAEALQRKIREAGLSYGLLTPLQAANQQLHPQFAPSPFRVQSAAVWFIARKLKEKGILTDEEV